MCGLQKQQIYTKSNSTINSHTRATTADTSRVNIVPVLLLCVSLRVCAVRGSSILGLRTAEGWHDGCLDVMWHELPLCHFVFPGGGFRGSAKRCLLPQRSPWCWTHTHPPPHTHPESCEQCFRDSGNYVKMCTKTQVLYFHLVWNFSYIRYGWRTVFHFLPSVGISLSLKHSDVSRALRAWTTLRTREAMQPGPPFTSSCLSLPLFSLSLLPLSLALSCWWPEQLYNWSSDGSFPADCSF